MTVQRVGDRLQVVGEQRGVGVEGDRRRVVAQQRLTRIDVAAAGNARRAAVPSRVARRETCLLRMLFTRVDPPTQRGISLPWTSAGCPCNPQMGPRSNVARKPVTVARLAGSYGQAVGAVVGVESC